MATELLKATPHGQTRRSTVGQLGGFDIELEASRVIAPEIVFRIAEGIIETRWSNTDWANAEPTRVIAALERRITRLDDDLESAVAGAERAAGEASRAKARLGQSFEHAATLARAERRQSEINEVFTPDHGLPRPEHVPERSGPSIAR